MNLVRFARCAFLVATAVVLLGAYAAHQFSLFQGPEALSRWTASIEGPNIALGWLFFIAALVFAFVKDGDGPA
jgi:hypothetical protein